MRVTRLEREVLDSGVPLIPQARRWRVGDLDDWLLMRLNFRWPAVEQTWRSKLTLFSSNNSFYFVTNEHATLLAYSLRDPVTSDLFVTERFAFARSADFKDGVWGLDERSSIGDSAIRALYRSLRQWSTDAGAARLYVGICSDMVPSLIKGVVGGYYTVGVTC